MKREGEEQLLLVGLDDEVGNDNGHDNKDATFVLIVSVLTAVCGSIVCGIAGGYSSPVQSAVMSDLGLSTAEYSLFGSLLTIGGLLGALVSGKLSDFIGCRGTLGLSEVLCLTGRLAIAFSQGAWSLDLGRLALGFANGLISYVVPVYIEEISPKNLRGGLVLLHQYSAAGMGTGASQWLHLSCLRCGPIKKLTFLRLIGLMLEEHEWMTDFSPYLALIGILIFSAAFPVGMGGIPFLIMSEIFPINIKGAAGSLATVVSFSSSWIVSYAFNFMMDWSSSGTFFIFGGVNIISLLFVTKLVPETKGRTLEEIQESLTCISF